MGLPTCQRKTHSRLGRQVKQPWKPERQATNAVDGSARGPAAWRADVRVVMPAYATTSAAPECFSIDELTPSALLRSAPFPLRASLRSPTRCVFPCGSFSRCGSDFAHPQCRFLLIRHLSGGGRYRFERLADRAGQGRARNLRKLLTLRLPSPGSRLLLRLRRRGLPAARCLGTTRVATWNSLGRRDGAASRLLRARAGACGGVDSASALRAALSAPRSHPFQSRKRCVPQSLAAPCAAHAVSGLLDGVRLGGVGRRSAPGLDCALRLVFGARARRAADVCGRVGDRFLLLPDVAHAASYDFAVAVAGVSLVAWAGHNRGRAVRHSAGNRSEPR